MWKSQSYLHLIYISPSTMLIDCFHVLFAWFFAAGVWLWPPQPFSNIHVTIFGRLPNPLVDWSCPAAVKDWQTDKKLQPCTFSNRCFTSTSSLSPLTIKWRACRMDAYTPLGAGLASCSKFHLVPPANQSQPLSLLLTDAAACSRIPPLCFSYTIHVSLKDLLVKCHHPNYPSTWDTGFQV